MLVPPSGTWREVDFVLDLFVARWLAGGNPSAGRFLGLDDLEDDSEMVSDGVWGVDFVPYRIGLGGGV